MEGMEDPEYYSSDFFVRTLGSEDIDVKALHVSGGAGQYLL